MKSKNYLIGALLVTAIWWGISQFYSPLVVPPISVVLLKIAEILSSVRMWEEVLKTVMRLLTGLGMGLLIGAVIGIVSGFLKPFEEIARPILGIIQVVPPISWLILAIIWFGFNGAVSIFIVIMSVIPTIAICMADGIHQIDKNFCDMGKLFNFSRWYQFRYIILPSIGPFIMSGFKIALGNAWKTVVMGEVLTTSSGIGGQITQARLNIETETVIAWTVIVVVLYYCSVTAFSLAGKLKKRRQDAGNKKFVKVVSGTQGH